MKNFILLCLVSLITVTNSSAFFWDNNKEEIPTEVPVEKAQEVSSWNWWYDPLWDWSWSERMFGYHQWRMNNLWDSFSSFPLDLEDEGNSLIAKIDIPNFNQEDISVQVKNGRWLIVQGQKNKNNEEKENKKYYYRERNLGSFSRQVLLPTEVNKKLVKATFENSTLTIVLPKEKHQDETDEIKIEIK